MLLWIGLYLLLLSAFTGSTFVLQAALLMSATTAAFNRHFGTAPNWRSFIKFSETLMEEWSLISVCPIIFWLTPSMQNRTFPKSFGWILQIQLVTREQRASYSEPSNSLPATQALHCIASNSCQHPLDVWQGAEGPGGLRTPDTLGLQGMCANQLAKGISPWLACMACNPGVWGSKPAQATTFLFSIISALILCQVLVHHFWRLWKRKAALENVIPGTLVVWMLVWAM